VGEECKGGIIVRNGPDANSHILEQSLGTGAVVQQQALVEGRLQYALVSGAGPQAGWVSLQAEGKDLVIPCGSTAPQESLSSNSSSFGAANSHSSTVLLNDGVHMPVFGLGVYRSAPGSETYNAVSWALQVGYRLVDTAAVYKNEQSVGEAIRDSGIPRNQIWVTTKLWDSHHGYDATIKACQQSLRQLNTPYVDLYLIHSPNTGKLIETWDALVELQKTGLVRCIGVSNFGIEHIEALRKHGRPLPAVNQVEMHPMVYKARKKLVEYCREMGIAITAYGSLFSGHADLMARPALKQVVEAHREKTPAQVLLRWALQSGFLLIPKSVKKQRLIENMEIFDFALSRSELDLIDTIQGHLGEYWDPLKTRVDLGRLDCGAYGKPPAVRRTE